MGILSRFSDIMKANINDMLDKCEDPSKMVDQTLRELKEDLAEVKKETAGVMAEEKNCKRRVDDLSQKVKAYDASARKALQAGNEEDAKTLLAKKQEYVSLLATANQTYMVAKQNSEHMQQMYNKLVSDINTLNGKRENIKAQVSMAKAQKNINKISSTINTRDKMDSFSRMEEKAQKMLDTATAESELSGIGMQKDEAELLQEKYATGTATDVDDELAKMKAEMGLL